ncbi:MAG: hypothetical protein ACE5JV_01340 [Nitrososphaerales archaeon]
MVGDVINQLQAIIDSKKRHASHGNALWEAYAKLEHAILLLKLEHDLETAGGFEPAKFDKTSREEELLALAIDHLEQGKRAFGRGSRGGKRSAERAIDNLRKGRDLLKMLLLKQ